MTATSVPAPSETASSDTGLAEAPTRVRRRRSLVLDSGWTGRFVFVGLALVLFLIPNVVIDDPTRIRQWAEYLCYAMIAVGLDIAWGYGGMLALGQGVFYIKPNDRMNSNSRTRKGPAGLPLARRLVRSP